MPTLAPTVDPSAEPTVEPSSGGSSADASSVQRAQAEQVRRQERSFDGDFRYFVLCAPCRSHFHCGPLLSQYRFDRPFITTLAGNAQEKRAAEAPKDHRRAPVRQSAGSKAETASLTLAPAVDPSPEPTVEPRSGGTSADASSVQRAQAEQVSRQERSFACVFVCVCRDFSHMHPAEP